MASAEAAFGLSTAALWGAADFSGGLAAKRAAPSFVVVVAHGFSVLLLLAAALLFHFLIAGVSYYGLLSGVFCGTGLVALYTALARGPMGLSAAISGVLTAALPVLYAWLREGRAGWPQMAGFALAAAAIWLVAYTPDEVSDAKRHPGDLWLAVFAGLCFGVMLVLMHFASAQGVLRALFWMRVGSASVAGLFGLWAWLGSRRAGAAAFRFPVGRWLLLAMLAGVLDTSGNLLYLFASLAGRLDVAAVLSSLYPAGTMLLAIWLLKERATRTQAVGMGLALAAVLLIAI